MSCADTVCQHSDTVLVVRRTEFDGMDGGPEKALLTVAKHQWRTLEEYALEYDRRSRDSWNRNGTVPRVVRPAPCREPGSAILGKRKYVSWKAGRMAEIVTIKIGPPQGPRIRGGGRQRDAPPRRRWEDGWDPMDESVRGEVWDRSSCWWKLEPGRAVRCDTAIVLNPDNVVVCVAEIRGVVKRRDIMRMGFLGRVAGDGYEPWYGRVIDRNGSKNPIAYFDERAILTPGEVTADTVRLNR